MKLSVFSPKMIRFFPQMSEEEAPELGLTLQNHFRAIDMRMSKLKHSRHRQSLVTLSRRHSMVQSHDDVEFDGPMLVRRISIGDHEHSILNHLHNHHLVPRSIDASMRRPKVCHTIEKFRLALSVCFLLKQFNRMASLDDLELESCQLAPATQERCILIASDEHRQQLLQRKSMFDTNRSVIMEDEES